jgi:hypothetical protein
MIATFTDLKEIIVNRRDNLLTYMPQTEPEASARIVDQAITPGTMAHAFMISLCAVIADELTAREYARRNPI